MPIRNAQDERLLKILGDREEVDFDDCIDMFFDYLQSHLSLPCEVKGIGDFDWEEFYVQGLGDGAEYKELKKNCPSHTDRYELVKLNRLAGSEWAMYWEEDIGACVRRISDNQEFVLGLSELKATDRKAKNRELLDDYSVWFVNHR